MVAMWPTSAAAQSDHFETCSAQLRSTAVQQGISEATITDVFSRIEQLPRVLASDRAQPEFTQTFADYYAKRVTAYRVEQGRRLLEEHRGLLQSVTAESGVPAQYLVAFWGLETNFGRYFGNLFIPSALATLACDSRRADFFNEQLMATLKIVDQGHMQTDQLMGSWAGAIGHMQFMPTTYLAHARDADGDQRANLVESINDAMASAGHYLQTIGWQSGFRWGREVMLPEAFDYALTGSDQWRALTEWSRLGVQDTAGQPLPELDTESAIILPAGFEGPAFLVYSNFKIIMKWNRSEFYALSVGRLADRIAGAGRLHTSLPDTRLSTAQVTQLQLQLADLGYQPGKADGVLGPGTRKATRLFQQDQGLLADGFPHDVVLSQLAKVTAERTE